MPTISIITINLNNRQGLEKTLISVINQSITDYQLVVIDGGSTDGSINIIRALSHKIHYWISEPDRGIYHAMNKGLAQAGGRYCLFLNSGDWLTENGLLEAVNACTGEDIIYFNCYRSYSSIDFVEQTYPSNLTFRSFYKKTIGHQSTLIYRDLFNRYGSYNETNRLHSDYEFWIKTIIIGDATCKYVNKFLCYYDMTGRSTTADSVSQFEVATALNMYIPQRVQDDYAYWYAREHDMEILEWYKANKSLYAALIFIYKVIKRIRKLVSIPTRKLLADSLAKLV